VSRLTAVPKKVRSETSKVFAEDSVNMQVLEEKLGYRIRIIERLLNKEFTRNVGMTTVQYSVFSLVATNQGLSQIAIGEALSMDRASTMAIIDKLEAAGLLERQKSVHDRRVHALQLTEKGRKQFAVVNNKVAKYDSMFSSKLSEEEMENFNKCLKKLMSS
jgi:MarR family transcriptional regulator, organic hydroperoxide resistance regulator